METPNLNEKLESLRVQAENCISRINALRQGGTVSANQNSQWSEDELLRGQARKYDLAWQMRGIGGLVDVLKEKARHEAAKQTLSQVATIWRTILHDIEQNKSEKTSVYLSSMHPSLVGALIRGDITKRMYENDPDFIQAIESAELDNEPGTYINIICRRKYFQPAQGGPRKESSWPGYGLTLAELNVVLQDCESYLRVQDPATNDLAKKIDNLIEPPNDTRPQRRFLPSDRAMIVIKGWIKAVREQIITPAGKNLGGRPMQRCFSEIGIGHKCRARAEDHKDLKGSNYLFGLVWSILSLRFPFMFELKALQLHRIMVPGDQSISEMELTLLGRAHYTDCGLNVQHGGGGDNRFAQVDQVHYERNAQRLLHDRRCEDSIAHDKQKRKAWLDSIESVNRLKTIEQEIKDAEDKALETAEEVRKFASGTLFFRRESQGLLDLLDRWQESHPAPAKEPAPLAANEDTSSQFEEEDAATVLATPTSGKRRRPMAEAEDDTELPKLRRLGEGGL